MDGEAIVIIIWKQEKERKEPERVENPHHCQIQSRNDFLFTPYPDLQDLGSSVLFVASLTFPSYSTFPPQTEIRLSAGSARSLALHPGTVLAYLVKTTKVYIPAPPQTRTHIFILIDDDLTQGQTQRYFELHGRSHLRRKGI